MHLPIANRQKQPKYPSWVVNVIGFTILIAIVLALFIWQQKNIRNTLQKNAGNRAGMVATLIKKNMANNALTQATIDEIVSSFLLDKARFIDYLNNVAPLSTEELTELAQETGLLHITVSAHAGQVSSSPKTDALTVKCQPPFNEVQYAHKQQVGYLNYSATQSATECISIILDAESIFALREETSLAKMLQVFSSLPGIHEVTLNSDGAAESKQAAITLRKINQLMVAEAQLNTRWGHLSVMLDATNFEKRQQQLRKQFLLFTTLLFALGTLFSWLLYQYQQADIRRTRSYEQTIAKEQEEAALGRATATIAHEVRNPLNAIGMGLQRLQLESDNLNDEEQQLLQAMGQAVHRAGTIIAELQRFTRPLVPDKTNIEPAQLIDQLLTLYHQQLQSQRISLSTDYTYTGTIGADSNLLNECMENLLKNSIQAQPAGGSIKIRLFQEKAMVGIAITNKGFTLPQDQWRRLGTPYFTTKANGNGLGLALVKKIVEAHGGKLSLLPDVAQQQLTVQILLPLGLP